MKWGVEGGEVKGKGVYIKQRKPPEAQTPHCGPTHHQSTRIPDPIIGFNRHYS